MDIYIYCFETSKRKLIQITTSAHETSKMYITKDGHRIRKQDTGKINPETQQLILLVDDMKEAAKLFIQHYQNIRDVYRDTASLAESYIEALKDVCR